MIDAGKHNILGVWVDAVDYEAAVERIMAAAVQCQPYSASALAVHGVMTGVLDDEHRYRLNHFDLIMPDGMPVRWALNGLHKTGLPDRVYGPTLMLKLCERAAQEDLPIYLYGSKPDVLEALQRNLRERFPHLQIAGASPSTFRRTTADEKQTIARRINDSGAALTFVGLGCPRQEVFAYEYHDLLPMPVVAVGAAFDFHAGTLEQAPPRLQRMGLEWLFRLIKEPKRLWRRYVLLNPAYLTLLFLQAARLRKFDPHSTIQPEEELLFG